MGGCGEVSGGGGPLKEWETVVRNEGTKEPCWTALMMPPLFPSNLISTHHHNIFDFISS